MEDVAMKTKCYSVRLQSLTSISNKCYKAKAFDGSEAFIPASQVFGQDYDVQKSESYWISAWILEKKDLQYSTKKEGWFNPEKHIIEPKYEVIIERHVPDRVEPICILPVQNLLR